MRNNDLVRDLKDIDRLARKAQADKEYTIEAADRELNEAKVNHQQISSIFISSIQIEIEHNHREMESLEVKLASVTNVCVFSQY